MSKDMATIFQIEPQNKQQAQQPTLDEEARPPLDRALEPTAPVPEIATPNSVVTRLATKNDSPLFAVWAVSLVRVSMPPPAPFRPIGNRSVNTAPRPVRKADEGQTNA